MVKTTRFDVAEYLDTPERQAEYISAALETGDADNASLLIGQDAGLIHDIPPAGEIVERIVTEAEALLNRLPKLVRLG